MFRRDNICPFQKSCVRTKRQKVKLKHTFRVCFPLQRLTIGLTRLLGSRQEYLFINFLCLIGHKLVTESLKPRPSNFYHHQLENAGINGKLKLKRGLVCDKRLPLNQELLCLVNQMLPMFSVCLLEITFLTFKEEFVSFQSKQKAFQGINCSQGTVNMPVVSQRSQSCSSQFHHVTLVPLPRETCYLIAEN